ncbi:MAG TPA: YceI family protein [Blastocatellia bacterium]|nr:YceI family protein [Blastocatellia bacterium]
MLAAACANPAADKPKAQVGAAVAAAQPRPEGSEALVISNENSRVEFVGSKVTGSHNGSFNRFSGTLYFVPNNLEKSQVTVDIETESVETDDPRLTGHLKSGDFFEAAKYPKATFVSTEISPGGANGATHTVTGNLELHGVKKAITFPARVEVAADSVKLNSEFAINRKDFGILYPGKPDDLIRDEVVIKLTINAPRSRS